jgi:hypothetical protein
MNMMPSATGKKSSKGHMNGARPHAFTFGFSLHASSGAFDNGLMVDVSSPDFRQVPIIRLTEPECPMDSLLAIQGLPTPVVSRGKAASITLRPSLFAAWPFR